MSSICLTFYARLFFFFVSVPQNNEISKDELYSFFNSELKRETPEELMYRRPLRKSEEFCTYVPKDLHLKDLYQRKSNRKNLYFFCMQVVEISL